MKKKNSINIKEICEKLFKENNFKIIYESSKDGYLISLSKNLDKYLEEIKKIEKKTTLINNTLIENIENLNKTLLNVIKIYLEGKSGQAYIEFKNKMDTFIYIASKLRKKLKIDDRVSFYRVRTSMNEVSKIEQLFHIPFDQRELVSTQRYSISGVPSLYLGSSIYCCWLEIGKPSLSQMYISRFQNIREIDILDFTISYDNFIPKNLDDWNDDFNKGKEDLFKSYLLMYPLIMACSYRKQFDSKPFIIEYIIPNLLLQWIQDEKSQVDAIQYYSTKADISEYTKNLVLPPKDFNYKYCSELVDSFTLTIPASWQLLDIFDKNIKQNNYTTIGKEENIQDLVIRNYQYTRFYSIEEHLKKLELKKVNLTN